MNYMKLKNISNEEFLKYLRTLDDFRDLELRSWKRIVDAGASPASIRKIKNTYAGMCFHLDSIADAFEEGVGNKTLDIICRGNFYTSVQIHWIWKGLARDGYIEYDHPCIYEEVMGKMFHGEWNISRKEAIKICSDD